VARIGTFGLLTLSLLLCPGSGQQVTQLTFETTSPTTKQGVAWSPDGDWITYSRGAVYGSQGAYGIHRIPPSGGSQQLLGPLDPNGPQWGPLEYSGDSQWIYFLKQDPRVWWGAFPRGCRPVADPGRYLEPAPVPVPTTFPCRGTETMSST